MIIRNQNGIKARLDSIKNEVASLCDEVTVLGKEQKEQRFNGGFEGCCSQAV